MRAVQLHQAFVHHQLFQCYNCHHVWKKEEEEEPKRLKIDLVCLLIRRAGRHPIIFRYIQIFNNYSNEEQEEVEPKKLGRLTTYRDIFFNFF